MSLDPHPSAEDQPADRPHAPVDRRADGETPARDPGAEPIRTLLWTAATIRPLEEVAALVSLLKRTRSVLRWPAVIVLLSCGVIHLPTDFTALRSGGLSDVLALAFTGLCLMLGVWLAVQDTVRIWAASGATAVGIIAAHSLSGAGGLNLLESSVGDSLAWAKVSAVACAVLTAVLAGAVLMRREKAAEVANDG